MLPARRPRPLCSAVLGALFTLTACGGGGDNAGASVTTAGDGAWRVTYQGFGPLLVGQSVAEAATAVGSAFAAADGADPACSYAEWPSAPAGVRVMLVQDTVVRIDVTDAGVATQELVRIGDNEGRLNSVYAFAMQLRPHKYTTGKYAIVTAPEDSTRRLVFETDGKQVTEFRTGRVPEVEWTERCG